jgi:sec-independent protein translocase protein TatB
VFDIGTGEILVLAIIALLVFGPERLPQVAAQAGRALRQMREMAVGARRDLRNQLGPEFADLDLRDLNPRSFVRKNLFDDDLMDLRRDLDLRRDFDLGRDDDDGLPIPRWDTPPRLRDGDRPLRDGERPPHDPDAT